MTSEKPTERGVDQPAGTDMKDGGDAQEKSDDLSQVDFEESLKKLEDAQTYALLKFLNIC